MNNEAKQLRKEAMQRLVDEGKTYQQVADMFDMSRQAVHQILTGYKSPRNQQQTSKQPPA